ncbi:MAG: DUF4956 domain-containing protein [Planctomycetota bacterium]
MDFLQDLFGTSGLVDTVAPVDMVRAALMAFFLSLIVGYTYRVTHQGPSYSQTTVHTMIIMSVTVSLIMLIIGTNIARAFSLVGALSIIRFRNAVKESRDVAFFFLAMAIGMACGTRHAAIAMLFTLLACPMIYALVRFQVGAKPMMEILLKMTMADKINYNEVFNEVFYKHLADADLLSVDADGSGRMELIYSVTMRKGAQEQGLLTDLRQVDDSVTSQLVHGHANVSM